MPNARDPDSDLGAWLGEELRQARLAAGYRIQEAFAREIGWERSVYAKAESGHTPASPDMAAAILSRFPELAGGRFAELAAVARKAAGIPGWFGNWLPYERTATTLSWWEPLLIPGLLQTEAYAQAILGVAWDITPDLLVDRMALRMERRSVLDGPAAPELIAVLDYAVISTCRGTPEIMHAQLEHLAGMMDRPNITIQVLPPEATTHGGLQGAFIIATFGSGPGMLYVEGAMEGQIVDRPDLIHAATVVFSRLRREALPAAATRELLMKVASEQWKL